MGRIDILVNAAGGNSPDATVFGDVTFFNIQRTAIDKMIDLNLIGSILPSQVFGEVMAKAGKENNRSDQLALARTELEETLKIRPDFVLARLLLTQNYINSSDMSKAVQSAEEVLSTQPANLQALLLRAVAWRGLREYPKAQATFEAILRANPNLGDARFHLGETFLEQQKYPQAEEAFMNCILAWRFVP